MLVRAVSSCASAIDRSITETVHATSGNPEGKQNPVLHYFFLFPFECVRQFHSKNFAFLRDLRRIEESLSMTTVHVGNWNNWCCNATEQWPKIKSLLNQRQIRNSVILSPFTCFTNTWCLFIKGEISNATSVRQPPRSARATDRMHEHEHEHGRR